MQQHRAGAAISLRWRRCCAAIVVLASERRREEICAATFPLLRGPALTMQLVAADETELCTHQRVGPADALSTRELITAFQNKMRANTAVGKRKLTDLSVQHRQQRTSPFCTPAMPANECHCHVQSCRSACTVLQSFMYEGRPQSATTVQVLSLHAHVSKSKLHRLQSTTSCTCTCM